MKKSEDATKTVSATHAFRRIPQKTVDGSTRRCSSKKRPNVYQAT